MSSLVFGLPTLLQVNECLITSMQICSFMVSRSGSLLTIVHMTDSSKDPIAANSATFSCSCLRYKKYREPKSLTAYHDSYLTTTQLLSGPWPVEGFQRFGRTPSMNSL